jgi:hypothetical protein
MSTGGAPPNEQLSIKYTAEKILAAEEHNVLRLNWSRNNSVNRLQGLHYGLDNRIIGVRFQTMVDFYLLQNTGTGSGRTQFLIQPLPRTFSPGREWPGREGNTLLPKLPVKAAAIPLLHTSSRPAAELNMGRSVPSFLIEEHNYSFS